jgi:hypothetical protein
MGGALRNRNNQGIGDTMNTNLSHADGNAVIARCKRDNGGFVLDTDVALIAADPATRLQLLLVRCGGGRFLAPAQDVAHFIDIIEENGRDHVRDVSIPAQCY